MKSEIIIRNWLMAWLKPEVVTEYQEISQEPLTKDNFSFFIEQFKDDRFEQNFSDEEKETLKQIIIGDPEQKKTPIIFATGYPRNAKETIQLGAIYIIGAGWQQTTTYPGHNRWDGRAASHITITGLTTGKDLNMAEPSLMLELITSLLIAGHNYFTYNHLTNPVITETLYGADEQNSYEKEFAMRTLSIAYEAERHGVTTYDPRQNPGKLKEA